MSPRSTEAPIYPTPARHLSVLGWAVIVTVLISSLVATYAPLIFKSTEPKFIGMLDHWAQSIPNKFYMDYSIQHGEIPLWNPLLFCGTPFAAHPGWHPFYPPDLIRSLLTFNPTPLKTHNGSSLMVALHVLLAGVGMVWLAREHGLSRSAAFVASFTFIFSAAFVHRVCANHFITAVAWAPVLLLVERRLLAAQTLARKLRYGIMGGLLFGLVVLAGPPQITYYTGILVAVYWPLCRLVEIRAPSRAAAKRLPVVLGGDLLALALICLVGALLAAVALLPGVEFAAFSARGANSSVQLGYAREHYSLGQLLKQLVLFTGGNNLFLDWRLAGTGVLLLALAALLHPQRRPVLLYVGLFWLLFDCLLGPPRPLATLVSRFAPFQMGPPARADILACLPLGMLAGFGVDAVTRNARSPIWARLLGQVLLVAVGAFLLTLLAKQVHPHPRLRVSETVVILPEAVVILPALVLLAMVLSGWLRRPQLWRTILTVLVFGDMLTWNYGFTQRLVDARGYKGPIEPLREEHSLWADNRRGVDPHPNRSLFALGAVMNGYDPLFIDRTRQVLCKPGSEKRYARALAAREVTADNYRGLLFLKRNFWLARQYVHGPLPDKNRLFPAATTVFLPEAGRLPIPQVELAQLPQSSMSGNVQTIHLGDAKTLAKVTQSKKPAKGFAKASTTLLKGVDLPPGHSALLLRYTSDCKASLQTFFEEPTTGELIEGKAFQVAPTRNKEKSLEVPMPDFDRFCITVHVNYRTRGGNVAITAADALIDKEDEDCRITILDRRANSVTVQVDDLSDYRVLTFLDADYPGWRAYVDDAPSAIYRADDAFKAVLIPPGSHRIRFVFRPVRVFAGLAISLAALLTSLGVLLWPAAHKERPRQAQPAESPAHLREEDSSQRAFNAPESTETGTNGADDTPSIP